MESLCQILEEELSDAVEVKNPKSLHRYIMILTENMMERKEYQAEKSAIKDRLAESNNFMRERFTAIDRKFEQIQVQMNQRFESLRQLMDIRFAATDEKFMTMQKQMDQRFQGLQEQMDIRFTAVDRKFNMMFTFLTIGFTALAILLTVFNYF